MRFLLRNLLSYLRWHHLLAHVNTQRRRWVIRASVETKISSDEYSPLHLVGSTYNVLGSRELLRRWYAVFIVLETTQNEQLPQLLDVIRFRSTDNVIRCNDWLNARVQSQAARSWVAVARPKHQELAAVTQYSRGSNDQHWTAVRI